MSIPPQVFNALTSIPTFLRQGGRCDALPASQCSLSMKSHTKCLGHLRDALCASDVARSSRNAGRVFRRFVKPSIRISHISCAACAGDRPRHSSMFLWPSLLLLCSLPLLHEVPVQFKRLGNVFGLRQFFATCHERMQPYTTQRVIHPVSGADINFEHRHAPSVRFRPAAGLP